jgi:hypothetical protein
MAQPFARLQPSEAWLLSQLETLPAATSGPIDPHSTLHPWQRQVIESPSRFKALLAARRSGKTELEDRDLGHGLLFDPPGSESLFFALTAESARAIFWRPLRALDRELRLGLKFDESKWTVTGPQRQILTVTGSETMRDLERKRGRKFRRIRGDECGAMRPAYLKYLLQDILEPTLMDDPESDIWLSGTPGPAPAGIWYEITSGLLDGWEVHRATAADNPSIVNYQEFIDGVLARWNWTPDTPKFRREYLGEWSTDPGRQVFRYDPMRNRLPALPTLLPGDHWVYGMAMDFGVGDATACVVLAWAARYGRAVYVVDAWAESGMSVGETANRGRVTWDKWRPSVLVGDVNGLGKYAEVEWNRRFQDIPMVPADKLKKRAALEFASDAMLHTSLGGDARDHYGLGVLQSVDPRLGQQLATVLWDEDRKDIQDGQDDDLAMALVYGWRASPAFLNLQASDSVEVPPKTQTQRYVEAMMASSKPQKPLERSFSGAFRRKRR